MQKNVTGQKWVVFAFDRTDNTPKTGDAANITANLRIDGGAANAVDDVNPTELEDVFPHQGHLRNQWQGILRRRATAAPGLR